MEGEPACVSNYAALERARDTGDRWVAAPGVAGWLELGGFQWELRKWEVELGESDSGSLEVVG